MKMKSMFKKPEATPEAPVQSIVTRPDGTTYESLAGQILADHKKTAREKSLCPRCLINAGDRIDVTGLKSCPNCGLKTTLIDQK